MIIGLTGTIGAGKGTIVEYLVNERGFYHASAREFLTREIARRGLPFTRDSMVSVADDFRKNYQPEYGYMVLALLAEAKATGKDAVIESVRAVGEMETLPKACPEIIFIGIDADPKIRFERIRGRGSVTDDIDFQKFLADDAKESGSKEPWRGNLPLCISLSDHQIVNNGDKGQLYAALEKLI